MFSKARAFFSERNVLEVDCPLITRTASVDAHIDLLEVDAVNEVRYLHSSPEYGMKRLLSQGMGDIYQLAHVFRKGEISEKHNPEFTMAEWYRLNFSFEEMIRESADFVRLFIGDLPLRIVSYREVFIEYLGIDYLNTKPAALEAFLTARGIIPYQGIAAEGKDAILNLILGSLIEPHLGQGEICALAYYPASQAALAKTITKGNERVAERFELYYKGIELANGYHELADATEQRKRFLETNDLRKQLGKDALPIDEFFLKALEDGLPDCCGVAIGFDRLMMLRHSQDIENVIPFAWNIA